jgi:hypothetical protein
MLKTRGRADLALEPLGSQGRGQLWVQHLQGHLAIVLYVLGEIDGGHPPPRPSSRSSTYRSLRAEARTGGTLVRQAVSVLGWN